MNQWQSCITRQNGQAIFTLDYFFTTEDFKPLGVSTPSQIPIRAVLKGIMNENGNSRDFHTIFEYLEIKAVDRLPVDTFSLPTFMICEGARMRGIQEFPRLPYSMSYILERVSSVGRKDGHPTVQVDVLNVFYDTKRKLVRTDQLGIISISDYRTGVEYHIVQDGCSTVEITSQGSASAAEVDGVVKMKNRPEIDYLKQEFHFSGKSLVRGISVLSFAGKMPDSDEILNAYVTENDKTIMGLVVENTKTGVKTHYNVFNFIKSAYPPNDDKNPFDIRRCLNSNQINEFDITVKYRSDYDGALVDWIEEIITGLTDYVAKVAGCSTLQISSEGYHIDESKQELQWFGLFLDHGSDVSRAKVVDQLPIKNYNEFFTALFSWIQNGNFEEKVTLWAPETIHYAWLTGSNFRSNGKDLEPSGVRESPLSKFNYYKDFCAGSSIKEGTRRVTKGAYECAELCLDRKWHDCNIFQYSKASKECTMSARENLPYLEAKVGCDLYTLNYRSHFEEFPGEVLLEADDVVHQLTGTTEACARQCLTEESFKCESFNYCEDLGRCYIYATHYYDTASTSSPSLKGDELISSCVHYSRRRLDDFKTMGSVDFALPVPTEVKVDSVQECAYLCQDDCVMFSSCLSNGYLVCKFVTASEVDQVTFEADVKCSVHNATGPIIRDIYADAADSRHKRRAKASARSEGYSGGAMFGVAVAMICTGVGVGVLTIFLLGYFKVWKGF